MLKVQHIETEKYICNQCGNPYNIRDAIVSRGNIYFCSSKCVLKYDKELEENK
jgi:hypothetical protein